jgi:SsrA-binding protein
MGERKPQEKNIVNNRRASFEYHFELKFVAGMQLVGTEIKSIRESKVNLGDAFCFFLDGELWVKNMYIAPYDLGSYGNHDPRRNRKLLLNGSELKKLFAKKEKGLTIIPIRLFISEKGLAKMEIALARGKKNYDKREDTKTRDVKREMARGDA